MHAPAEQSRHIALGVRGLLGFLHISANAGIALEIGLDIGARRALLDADLACETEGRDAINDAEIDRLGAAPDHRVHALDRHAEHLARGERVNIDALLERLLQRIDIGHVREDAQLDL